jgi:hypothetical protein
MTGPEAYVSGRTCETNLPVQSVPGAVPGSPEANQHSFRDHTSDEPLPKSSARVSFDAPTTEKPARRHTVRQRTASKLASAVSLHSLTVPPPSKAEVLAKQNRAIANIKAPSKHITRLEKVTYEIDQHISTRKGQIFTLSVVGLILIMIGGMFLKAVQPSAAFGETVWESWTYLADTGSHTSLAKDVSSNLLHLLQRCTNYCYLLLAGPASGWGPNDVGGHPVLLGGHGLRR